MPGERRALQEGPHHPKEAAEAGCQDCGTVIQDSSGEQGLAAFSLALGRMDRGGGGTKPRSLGGVEIAASERLVALENF